MSRASPSSAPDHPLARSLPRGVTEKHVIGSEPKQTKTAATSKRRYGENQRPERTMKHNGRIFKGIAFDAPFKSFFTDW